MDVSLYFTLLILGKGTCKGDSGSPLVYRDLGDDPFYQVGIASFGNIKCGLDGIPGVYTKVEAYLPWIESKLKL